MKFQGDIAAIPITDVVQNLSANRKGGTLTIRRGEEVRRIACHEGKIISYTDNVGFSIPRWLEAKKLVDADLLRKAVAKARKSRRKNLGEILGRASAMKEQDYRVHLKSLVEEMLYETFTLREGTFEFHENELDSEALDPEVMGAKLELAVGPILIESARRLDDWEAIRKSLPSENDIYRVAASERSGYVRELQNDELAVAAIKLLDGSRSIREVIAGIPSTRFEASRVIADLVTRKWARPIDGSELMSHLGACSTPQSKSRALIQLKAALEREPGNRVLLKKVAELSLAAGNREESAVYHKLLASALLEDGEQAGAEKELRQSLKLNPKDIGIWQKLYELLEQGGDGRPLMSFGMEMAKHLRRIGLEERARDHLAKMLERFPSQVSLRLEHADTLFALGDRNQAVEALLTLARDLMKKDLVDDAERALAKVLEYDREHKRAKEIYDKIRTGKLARVRAKRRLVLRAVLASVLMAVMGAFVGYDFYARREFLFTVHQVFAEGLIERGEYAKAADRLKEVRDRHFLSLIRYLEEPQVLGALREVARRQPPPKGKAAAPTSRAATAGGGRTGTSKKAGK